MERLTERVGEFIRIKGCKTLYASEERKGAYLYNAIVRLAKYEDVGLEPKEIIGLCDMDKRAKMADMLRLEEYQALGPIAHLRELVEAEREGRCLVLPCKVGDTVFVIDKCENVIMNRDDDYFTGTGAVECPFESSCGFEDCQDDHIRIFETTVTDFWVNEENDYHLKIFLAHMGRGYVQSEFGKVVFLTREEAEAAQGGGVDDLS